MTRMKYTNEFVSNYFREYDCELLTEYIGVETPLKYKCKCGNIVDTNFSLFMSKKHKKCKECTFKENALSFDYVKKYFEENNCVLLELEYINSCTPMRYLCKCGNESTIRFSDFKEGKRCKSCWHKRATEMYSFDYNYVSNYFLDNGYKLLSDQYINNTTKLITECPEGHTYETNFQNFRAGCRCSKCYGNAKYTYEEVYNYFKINGCELLDTNYSGVSQKLKYKCVCGNIGYTTFHQFKNSEHICRECANKRISERQRFSFDFVKDYIENYGFKLLSDRYENAHQLLEIECNEGHIYKASFDLFRRGCRCPICFGRNKYNREFINDFLNEHGCILLNEGFVNGNTPITFKCHCGEVATKYLHILFNNCMCNECYFKTRRGENNNRWNPNLTDEERENNRKFFEYEDWRKSVLKRDDYTCQCCGTRGGILNVHHLDGWNWAIDKRVDIDNGITLCEECHIDFHFIYGYGDNTKEQFEEYMNDILNDSKLNII